MTDTTLGTSSITTRAHLDALRHRYRVLQRWRPRLRRSWQLAGLLTSSALALAIVDESAMHVALGAGTAAAFASLSVAVKITNRALDRLAHEIPDVWNEATRAKMREQQL